MTPKEWRELFTIWLEMNDYLGTYLFNLSNRGWGMVGQDGERLRNVDKDFKDKISEPYNFIGAAFPFETAVSVWDKSWNTIWFEGRLAKHLL